ncbi:MAG: BrnT family toxin [Deltaproteobacteria bacterium]|nr:BrnT family toxin [Deltaproteobacteria bacterium]
MEFEWDPKKEAKNIRKHKVSFSEAATVFGDPLSTTVPDPDHSQEEDRSITIGMSQRPRPLMVAHTERGERIRIISARELTPDEREAYEEETYK